MKAKQLFFFLSLFIVFSCSTKHQKVESAATVVEQPVAKQELKAGEIMSPLFCVADPSESYAVYLPKNYSDSIKFPVIIFFDPHGSGVYPVALYKSLADEFGYILMGSNTSKNGLQFDQTNAIVSSLITEAGTRFSTDKKRIALAGFSGGAKAALIGASNHPELVSVIYCGAAIPFESIQQLPPALGFAGVHDMNYTEVMSSSSALEEKKFYHALIEWKGKHEWPDSISFEEAFYWCGFNAMRNKIIPVDKELIRGYLKHVNSKEGGSTYVQFNQNLNAFRFLEGLADVSMYQGKVNSLSNSDSFRKEMQKRQSMMQSEINLKQNYGQCFETKDLNWWKDEITRMRKIRGTEEQMYRRLLGYLSLASYSYSNSAIKQNNFPAAQQFLAIYKLADPENSEQPFLTACMYARQGDQGKAIAALQEALQLGLKDKAKIANEESFGTLHSNADFNRLLNKL